MRVFCKVSRRVADDEYVAGQDYEMEDSRAARYADYFDPLFPLEPQPRKQRTVKGWRNRSGAAVKLDGTPAE